MRTLPPDIASCGAFVFGVRLQRRDGTVLGWTEHDRDQTVTVGATPTLLLANPGMDLRTLVMSAGLDVDTTEIEISEVGDDLTRAEVLARKWDGAKVDFFLYNWRIPGAGVIRLSRGSLGNFNPVQDGFRVEYRDMRQALQTSSTWTFQETCRWRLGDARCGVDLADYTFEAAVTDVEGIAPVEDPTTGALTAVTSASAFTASGLAGPANYFRNGLLIFTSGVNKGRGRVVAKDAGGGVLTMAEAFPDAPAPGDVFSITREQYPPVAGVNSFTADGLDQPDDYFGYGTLTWLTGLNAGTPPYMVRTFAAGGVVGLAETMLRAINVGDTFSITAGCRRRWEEDCKEKFDNLLNFGGEKDKPLKDDLVIPGKPGDA